MDSLPERYTRVVIGIQAKTDLPKFPRMVMAKLEGKRVLDHVIERAISAAKYLNSYREKQKLITMVALAIPEGDEIKQAFKSSGVRIVEGADHDILKRYKKLADELNADYVVRITADCPMIPPHVIQNHAKKVWKENLDYVSNVCEKSRLAPDGWDCEAISRELLEYTHENATLPEDRMHVTTYIRKCPPEWARIKDIKEWVDLSRLRFRVSTPSDLEQLRQEMRAVSNSIEYSERTHGKGSIGH